MFLIVHKDFLTRVPNFRQVLATGIADRSGNTGNLKKRLGQDKCLK